MLADGTQLETYPVIADGQRFLLNSLVDESGGAPLTLEIKWQAGLKR
jgi:hypothetical protein